MRFIAETVTDQCESTQLESATGAIDLCPVEELFGDIEAAYGDIAEIINENFILEVEASRRGAD